VFFGLLLTKKIQRREFARLDSVVFEMGRIMGHDF
jgi:hypothetical protein